MGPLRQDLKDLYRDCCREFFFTALGVTGCASLAEDALQDAFCRALRLKQRPVDLKAYMFKSVRNAAVDIIRRRSHVPELTQEDVRGHGTQPGRNAEMNQFIKRLVQAMTTLTVNEREAVIQRLVANLTFREIAELQNRPFGTVTSWYHRGLVKLRKEIEDSYG